MLIKQELVTKLKDYFGLNIYETKVWLALIKKGIASAGEIASISGVPRSRTYDVLESLEKRGFAIAKLEKPVKYMGIKPKIILEKLKNNVKKEADDKLIELSNIRNTGEFEELESLYNLGMDPVKTEDASAALKGRTNISNQIRESLDNAHNEVIICTNVEEIMSREKIFQQTFSRLKKSNIKLMVALSGNENLIKQLSERLNVKIQKITISAKFFIIDRKEILFYLSKNKGDDEVAIWLNSEFFAQAFASLFEKALN